MKVNGQLKNAQLEIVSTDPVAGTKGRIVYNSDCDNPVVDTGSDQTRIQVEADNPVGQIIIWPLDSAPNNRWVECNGQTLTKATQAELYDVIGGSYGETATTFNVPDYRGYFLRGEDPTNVRDTDARTSKPNGVPGTGSTQTDDYGRHTHAFTYQDSTFQTVGLGSNGPGPNAGATGVWANVDQNRTGTTQGSGNPTETRPINISVKFFIKVK